MFGETINEYQDGSITRRLGKFLNEIHGDGIPWPLRNGKLLEKPVWSVVHRFGARTSGARFAVVLDIGRESGPVVVEANLVKGLGLTIMSCKGMVVRVLKNTKA